jgi:hypothetical protein
MGGSGGGIFDFRPGIGLQDLQRIAQEETAIASFQTTLSALLGDLLSTYNSRDSELVAERLEPLLDALSEEHSGNFNKLFGGSVAKHTFVDGLSDIDCLVILNGSELHGDAPSDALKSMAAVIGRETDKDGEVSVGRMAVTVRYADGMEIQLLPAVDDGGGRLRVPSNDGQGWSKINPQTFRAILTKRNEECGGKLVPTIKLAKAVLANSFEGEGLSGYHVESLAIEAFRDYNGAKTTAAMLPTFFERARTLVLEPMRDSTGQSVHVDTDLGPPNSSARQEISFELGRIARQMRTASAAGSRDRWLDFFGLSE